MRLCLINEDDAFGANGAFRQHVWEQLTEAGHQVMAPWSIQTPRSAPSHANARKEYWYRSFKELGTMLNDSNCELIEEVDLVIYLASDAASAAAGAALGYAHAKATPIILLRGNHYDADRAEDPFDLQLESLVAHGGGRIVTTIAGLLAALMMREAERELRAAG